ncbi:stAR-related lipid transfer protein 9 isoform X2 [Esox lucius]|uniref:stAR-related lipid transfer protein 9 isoform X2 n=1 Tax=Esox lucius TaxID=8010 RepID=UPI001477042F|nr:stAR-related lipid transfer protein 9 isoform X2 [Esox lucius]
MANVKVAIRVRPLNARESVDGGRLAVQVEGNLVRIKKTKLDGRPDVPGDSREKFLEFGFDYCYWSVAPEEPHYASQEEVFQDLGVSVLAGASEGYNVCLFAYGQTGTGKTYTMMGAPDSMGLTPRICQGLFTSDDSFPEGHNSTRVEISFLEIYNERVRDLLRGGEQKKIPLRVREHPDKGPYVQDLSQHVVSDYKQAVELLEEGIANRITAATHVHDASSRSHAIFTIQYTQAILENNLPSEIVSKINLVDLAGSERADPHYCRDRLTEGSNINKSLVTLGIVISALAQNSQMSNSCQSINSVASEGDGGSIVGSHSSSLSGGGGGRRHCFIPYRDSVLTWLLKDSLGGNSKTIMIATVSPSCSSYNETLSTLRYAAHARNIVNKPRVNEDASVRLIRELRQEIDRLKSMLLSYEMRNPSPSLSDERDGSLSDMVLQNELKVDQLTKDWSESWRDKKELLEQYSVDINRDRAGFLIHSLLPHLISLDRDILSTGVTFYHLREGITRIGPQDKLAEPQIVLQGGANCEIENHSGVVTLRPLPGSSCMVNDREVVGPCRLAQGSVVTLGGVHKFRFNHPAEAAALRERRRASEGTLSCNSGDLCAITSESRVEVEVVPGRTEDCEGKEPPLGQQCEEDQVRYVEEQRGYVECLRQEIHIEQRQAERDLEREQAHLRKQHIDIQQWILQENQRLAAITLELRETQEFGVQTDPTTAPILDSLLTHCSKGSKEGFGKSVPFPSKEVLDRKKVVQEELLRHHALRRAESQVRRKRLQYQLQRIAHKRHLLEAKRELQMLEKALPSDLDGPASPEQGWSSKSRGRQPDLRRHSFSSDLLSRLYPKHTPIFSHFLKKTRPSDLTFGSIGSRRWVSDECLPHERKRSRSNTFSSETGHSRQELGFRSSVCSSENHKSLVKNEALASSPCRERPEKKPLLPKRGLELTFKNSQNSSQSHQGTSSNVVVKEPGVTIRKCNSQTQKAPCKGLKNLPRGSSKGLENIRNVFLRSVGPGIKTALARIFRKPPSGLSCGARLTKPLAKTASRFLWKQNRGLVDTNMNRKKGMMKTTVSCEDLDQKTTSHSCKARQRKWHSAETLMSKTSMLKWVEKQHTLGLAGWEEYDGEEEESGGDHSDCDSSFSVDSLSSAYATALAEQLVQEEAIHSEADSEDSQMSKDSLAVDSRGIHDVSRPAQRLTQAVVSQSAVRDFPKSLIGKTMNLVSEITLTGEGVTDVSSETSVSGAASESLYQMQAVTESRCRDTASSPESGHVHITLTSRGSLNSCSAREPEDQLVLTDAWSSIDAAGSPSIPRETMLRRRLVFSHGVLDGRSNPSPISVDVSDCQSGFGVTRSHSSESSDCTEGECVGVEKQQFKVFTGDTNSLNLPDFQLNQTLAPHVMAQLSQEQMCCEGHFERLVSSQGLPVSIDSTGFHDNESRDFTSECSLCSSTKAPTFGGSIQDIPSTLEDERFNAPQMELLTLSPEVLFLGEADIKNCTDAGLSPHSPHFKSSMETLPKTKGEMGNKTYNVKSASNSLSEDNEHCNIDGEVIGIRDYEFSEISNTKDKSLEMLQKLENKATDQNCESKEQAFFSVSCKNSRKRNKGLQDSFIGILKIPKRSNGGDFLTSSTSQLNSQEVIWSDGKNNTSKLEDKQTSPSVHALKLNLDCKEGNFKQDASTLVEMSVALDVSQENTSLCSHKIVDTGGHKVPLFEEEAVIEKRIQVERDVERQIKRQDEKLISGSVENGRWGHHHADSNCISIDQRISEVVKEHTRMSAKYWDGDNSNSELDSESSPNMNVLPTCHSNKWDSPKDLHPIENHEAAGILRIITPDSTSQKPLICSERLSMDGTIDMTEVSHGRGFAHCESLTVMSANQASSITKDCVNVQDSSKTNVLSEFQLSQSIQWKDVSKYIDIREDNSQDISGFSIITLNDQASDNSGAASLTNNRHEIKLNLSLDSRQGQTQDINNPKPLKMRWSSGSNSTSETPKERSISQENIFERDVPFVNMENAITFIGNNNKQTVTQACSLQQTVIPRGTMSETLPSIDFALAKDTIVDSEHEIHKDQCKLTSTCSSGQLDLYFYHCHEAVELLSDEGGLQLTAENTEIHNDSRRLANNSQSVDSVKMVTVSQTEKKDRGLARARKELQRDTAYATNVSQDLPKSNCSSETQVDTIHKICVIVDPDHKKKHQRLKHDKCHVENWLKAQCNVVNFASNKTKDCQMAENENVSVTKTQLSPATRFDGSSEINTTDPSQKTQECSDVNRKILGDICRDIISKEKHTKTSKCPLLYQFTGSSVINCNKGKSKRFRRSKAHAPPSSSSNSTIKSSSDEEENISPRQHRSKSLSTRMIPGTQTKGKLEEINHCNSDAIHPSESQSPESIHNHNMEACATWNLGKYGKSNISVSLGQKAHYLKGQSAQALTMSSGLKETQMSHYTPKPQDSALHFASSDINPFVHQWKEQQSQRCYKNQLFGSAADITCKSPLPDATDKRIARCCSVDNGLNLQNCPFNSHLSTYANNKGLSSTLSSMEEYFKDQTSPKVHQEGHANQASGGDNQNQHRIQNVSVNSSCSDVPGGPGNSSGQVDEIMLVYCSEQESQCNRFQMPETHNTQDHSTQTSITQVTMTQTTIDHGDLQRNNCLRRSSTPVPMAQNNTKTGKETTTWASLQNMSEHLSKLIHNTSDLLGNIQGMRSGEQSPIRNVTSHLHSLKDCTKKPCSTQAAVDIGIQTEIIAVQDKMSSHQTQYTERPIAHEVNVIVKVIGSEVLNVSQDPLKNRQDNTIQSMPDLQINGCAYNQTSVLEPENCPPKIPSMATVVQHNNCLSPSIHHRSNECCIPKRLSSSKSLAVTATCNDLPEVLRPDSHNGLRRSDHGIGYRKQVSFTDRACSPILTVGPRSNSNKSNRSLLQSLKEQQHFEMQNRSKEYIMQGNECQSTPCLSFSGQETCMSFTKNDHMPGHNSFNQSGMSCDLSIIKSARLISLKNMSALSLSSPKGSDGSPESPSLSIDKYIQDERSVICQKDERSVICQKERESPRWSVPSVLSSNAVTTQNHNAVSQQEEKSISTFGHRLSYRRHSSECPLESYNGAYQPSPISDYAIQFQEDDMLSLAPSECNTDILLNINPVTQTFNFQPLSQQQDNPELPEDLPVHNKFTNWSGISQHPSDRGQANCSVNPAAHITTVHEAQRNQADWAALHSQESRCSRSPGYPFEKDVRPRLSLSPESSFPKDRKRREIERLRKEREQVMATVHLNMNPHPLTVELAEAKLHYGHGETDTLLKILASGGTKEKEPSAVPTKQQLYDRHRRSIDGLRLEREAHLQTCRRARSLSPGKHHSPQSPPQSRTPPQEAVSSRVSALPSRRRDYLQQLRQEVVESSRIPDPPRGEGHYPSEIEQLLRDYGRAREEARTEIARARERLRERTEQEKRRLQQQALSQVVKDDLRYRTRVSNSTLCTGSSLSLSSGPTSGYNSGYTAQLMDGSRPSLTLQATGVLDDGLNGLKVRSRPPICSSQTVKTQRAWLSAQDIRLEPGVSGSEPLISSNPPSPSGLRQRTASFGSASSISTAYQDLTSCLLGQAMAEVRLAGAGNMENLVNGKAAAGWRYHGVERGVQAFYKPSSSPSVHSFMGAVELERPLASLWSMVRDHSKIHLYQEAVRSAWTRPLDDCTQLVYLLTETSTCHLKQPRDFCCISTLSQQDELCVLAMQSVFEESLPRPNVEAVRGEMLPSAWVLQAITRHGREVVRVIYLLQVDLGSPSLPQRLLGTVARRQAAVLAELDSLFSL